MAHNILIVDDSRVVRAVIARTLRIAGVNLGQVLEASNGREGLAALEANRVDLIFADLNMPEMNGIQMVEAMRQKGFMENIPVVIVSTERSLTRIEELKAKGVAAYLNKPFTPENIKEVLEHLLKPCA